MHFLTFSLSLSLSPSTSFSHSISSLFLSLSSSLSLSLSICLCLFLSLSLSFFLYVFPSVCLSFCLSACQSNILIFSFESVFSFLSYHTHRYCLSAHICSLNPQGTDASSKSSQTLRETYQVSCATL